MSQQKARERWEENLHLAVCRGVMGRKTIVLARLRQLPLTPLSFAFLSSGDILLLIPQLIDLLLRVKCSDLIGSYCLTQPLKKIEDCDSSIPAMQPDIIESSCSITL